VNDHAERYTVRKALSESAEALAVVWCLVAFICVLLALLPLPWLVDVVSTILLGPVMTAMAVLGRVRNMRRRGR
jgi:uncharacterized membrane protein